MPKPEKIQVVDKLKKEFEETKSVFVTDYTGLNVADITLLRKDLRENSIKYLVAKNTLIRIAAKETGYDNIIEHLEGQTALAFAKDDPAVAAKILYDSFKNIEKPVIKAFVLDNELFPGADAVRLAELPSKEILLSQIVSAVESPLTAVVNSIDCLFQELMGTLDALAASKG